MKKGIFVIQSLGFGGAERSLVNLLHELPANQYDVDLLLFRKKGAFLRQVPRWVRVLETPSKLKLLYSPFFKAGKLWWTKLAGTVLSRLVKKTRKESAAFRWNNFYRKKLDVLPEKYDFAVAYSGSEVLYFVHDCINAEKKLVWIHNDYRAAQYSYKDDLPYLANMDVIASVSDECVNILKDEFPQYASRCVYMQNITSSTLIRKQAEAFFPEEYDKNMNILLSIGRLEDQKGFDVAISAAAIMKKRKFSFCWYIIGEGNLREVHEKQIREEHVEDCVILLGTRDNPYPYIKNCTILVQPSRFEGKSVVLDEAKILGTPIVATNYPTVRDQILEGHEGIITPMTPEEIAEEIQKLLEDPTLLAHIRDYLRSHEYGNQKEIKKYIELLG